MRLKKGFTLAEVLVVLMIIGAIATLTIPSLMQSVGETQWKTAYKKAFNTIVNVYAMQRITGAVPGTSDNAVTTVFDALVNNLSIKDYAAAATSVATEGIYAVSQFHGSVTYKVGETLSGPGVTTNGEGQVVTNENQDVLAAGELGDISPWINTEDGLSYAVVKGGSSAGQVCGTKTTINAQNTSTGAADNSCAIVVVDVNGLTTGPNTLEPQVGSLDPTIAATSLTGDRYYIYIGRDGVASGNRSYSIMGRILADTH